MIEALTYGEWVERGFQVMKGQKSKVRGPTGAALFTRDQVKLKGLSGDYYDEPLFDHSEVCDY